MDELQEEKRPLLAQASSLTKSHSYGIQSSVPEAEPSIHTNGCVRWVATRNRLLIRISIIATMVAIPLSMTLSMLAASSLPRRQEPDPTAQGGSNYYGSVKQVIASDFPDPAILYCDGITYAYSTNSGSKHIPMATSTDNVTFEILNGKDALPNLAAWENPINNGVWAPDVVQVSNDRFIMYYASRTYGNNGQFHCIGAASASSPLGPFVPVSDQPLICPNGPITGGAIDPEGFHDTATGNRYIAYKIDGNAIGHGGACNNGVAPLQATPIMLQEVDASDGITLVGEPVQLLDRDVADGPLIEAPSLYRSKQGVYFVFFSSQCFSSPSYSTNYATSTGGVMGPYIRAERPLLMTGTGPGIVGPGGLDVMVGGNGLVALHGHVGSDNGIGNGERGMPSESPAPLMRGAYVARLRFDGRVVGFVEE